ncbi:MAG TPA: hypothetical protein VHB25_18000 [Gemmatimonadaceae bacterium]|nr:hypothetical protein [Gemmatimonadaceae bacterium]
MTMMSSVAAALAVLPPRDDAPRVIQQFTSIFLVSRLGEIWRVYDTNDVNSADRRMPSETSARSLRMFVALARKTEIRVHTFAPGESREIDPAILQRQLDDSVSA